MAEQKYTPGPWYVRRVMPDQVRESNYIDIVNVQEGKLSDYIGGWLVAEIDAEHPVDEANARLIAKAPEMLDMLKKIEWILVDMDGPVEGGLYCPFCFRDKDVEHHDKCSIQVLLKEIDNG